MSVLAAVKSVNNAQEDHFGAEASSNEIKISKPIPDTRPRKEPDIGKIVAIVVCALIVLFVISVIALAFTRSELPPCLGYLSR